MRTKAELAEVTRAAVAAAAGAVRRMAVTMTGTATAARAIWQLAGFKMPSGSVETVTAEVFGGIGVFSRPPSDGKPEAIVIMVADGKVPVAIAVRDEKTRQAIAAALLEDETMLYNSQAAIHVTAAGKVEARSKDGIAVPLMTLADGQAMHAELDGHAHTYTVEGSPFQTTFNPSVPPPIGTTVLKGE